MYISGTVIVIIIGVVVLYFYLKSKSKQEDWTIKASHFEKKYKKELAINEGFSQRVGKFSELLSDLINLYLVKRLIEEDRERYERLTGEKNKTTEDSLEKWIETSDKKAISELRSMRKFHREALKKLDEVINLQQTHLSEYIEKYSNMNIRFDLDDIMGAFIYMDAFYRTVSKHKYLTATNTNVLKFGEEVNKLIDKLDELIVSINDRYYSRT